MTAARCAPLRPLLRLLGLALALATATAHADRPLFTEDAVIADPGACVVEAWAKRGRGGASEYWVMPACNPTGNFEITVGAMQLRAPGERDLRGILQGKTIFRALEPNGWGWGLVFGNEYGATTQRPLRNRLIGDLYALVPVSWSVQDERWLVHANLGWMREREERRDRATYSLGTEYAVTPRIWAIGEMFGESGNGRPFYHVGVRYWIVPERLQIDASYGNRFGRGTEDRFFTIGIAVFTDSILR
ncbi:MAG TPA: hypothetical protein VM491_03770 [Burkholderiaceae bacterium]|nr:hypothetical protein [Burkholderiaceae bacterium]